MQKQELQHFACLACVPCSERKRKCDRAVPQCGLCTLSNRECMYPYSLPELERVYSQQALIHLESPPSSSASKEYRNDFPVALFLDSTVFTHCGMSVPSPSALPLKALLSHIGNAEESRGIAARYFSTLHSPLAFVSKIRFYGYLLNSPPELRPDVALLVLCMKLINSEPRRVNIEPESAELYKVAKESLLKVELSKALTLSTLQSALLIALYEIGHGIYPSAYLTVGWCSRYGTALGLELELGVFENSPGRWIEKEERNRAWWTVLTLDRHVYVGSLHRSLCTPDPSLQALLPVDDDEWDRGEWRERHPLRLDSTETVKASRFARVVQAMNLLSMSIRIAAEVDLNRPSTQDHIIHLDRTLRALWTLNGTCAEVSAEFCVPHTICVDALITLHCRLLLERHRGLQRISKEQSQSTLASISRQSDVVLSGILEGYRGTPDQYCPLLLSWIYRSAAVSTFLHQVAPCEEHTFRIQTHKQALNMIGKRWLVADIYLRLLESRELTGAPLTLPS